MGRKWASAAIDDTNKIAKASASSQSLVGGQFEFQRMAVNQPNALRLCILCVTVRVLCGKKLLKAEVAEFAAKYAE